MNDFVNYLVEIIQGIDLSKLMINYYLKKFEPEWSMEAYQPMESLKSSIATRAVNFKQ